MRTTLAIAIALVAVACNTGGTPNSNAALVGTWFAQITPATSDNQTATLTFRADNSYTLVHTQDDPSTSVTPGCRETQTDVGTFTTTNSSGMMSLALTPTAATSGTIVITMCTSANDNGMRNGTPMALTGMYTVSGNTLTLGGGGSGTTFTRM